MGVVVRVPTSVWGLTTEQFQLLHCFSYLFGSSARVPCCFVSYKRHLYQIGRRIRFLMNFRVR